MVLQHFMIQQDNVIEDVMFENGVRKGQEFLLVGEYREEDYQKLLAKWKEQTGSERKTEW